MRRAVAAMAALTLIAGCGTAVEDPRDISSEEAQALERAAHTGKGDGADAGVTRDRGAGADRGEARDAFALLRPAAEASDHPLSEYWGLDRFAILDNGEAVFEWANRDELWNEIVVPVGEACRQAGPPIDEPLFDAPEPLRAAVDAYWNNRSTSGRGTLVTVMCAYVDDERGPVERYQAHLVATDPDTGKGRLVARSEPWEFAAREYDSLGELVDDRDAAMAEWARQQNRVDVDPMSPAQGYGLDAADAPDSDAADR